MDKNRDKKEASQDFQALKQSCGGSNELYGQIKRVQEGDFSPLRNYRPKASSENCTMKFLVPRNKPHVLHLTWALPFRHLHIKYIAENCARIAIIGNRK